MTLLLRWLINALALLALAAILPGVVVSGFWSALIAALVLGLVNALVRPVLFILTLPITLLTLGLFTFVLNALMVWLVSSMVKGFDVMGFSSALLVALGLWAVSLLTNALIKQAKETKTHF